MYAYPPWFHPRLRTPEPPANGNITAHISMTGGKLCRNTDPTYFIMQGKGSQGMGLQWMKWDRYGDRLRVARRRRLVTVTYICCSREGARKKASTVEISMRRVGARRDTGHYHWYPASWNVFNQVAVGLDGSNFGRRISDGSMKHHGS